MHRIARAIEISFQTFQIITRGNLAHPLMNNQNRAAPSGLTRKPRRIRAACANAKKGCNVNHVTRANRTKQQIALNKGRLRASCPSR